VIEIHVAKQPEQSGTGPIQADGTIDLGPLGQPRIEGKTTEQIASIVAELTDVPRRDVEVRVTEFNSRQIFVFGQVNGISRSVEYQGPERIVDFLDRIGGLQPGASLNQIDVVRPRLTEGKQPQVFHVDLEEILEENNPKTNLWLEPGDHVYVGETTRYSFSKILAPWLRNVYRGIHGISCPEEKAPATEGPRLQPQIAPPETPPKPRFVVIPPKGDNHK
jgi:protein involved in polysaccharide export with SLBB domain